MESRFELKFLIDASHKKALMEQVVTGLTPDAHGEQGCYRVTSLYYDSPELRAYWEKLDGVAIREKVRLRYYGESPEQAFLEIKRRYYNQVIKHRVRLAAGPIEGLLDGESDLREARALSENTKSEAETLSRIHYLAVREVLSGTAITTYLREAWEGPYDNRLRVTFDHLCQAHFPGSHRLAPENVGFPLFPDTQILMEVKFNNRLPLWLRDGLNRCQIRPTRFSKYAEAVTRLGRYRHEALERGRDSEFAKARE